MQTGAKLLYDREESHFHAKLALLGDTVHTKLVKIVDSFLF